MNVKAAQLIRRLSKFTLQGTNTYLVGSGHERILIDTGGGDPRWAELIAAEIESMKVSIRCVLLTHWHGDHTGGVPDLICLYPNLKDRVYKNTPDTGQQPIVDGQLFSVDGATIRAVYTPGHAEDHMCFVLEEENALFTGDNILGQGTSVVEDLRDFMNSLVTMQAQGCQVGHSAHGTTLIDLPGKIKRELAVKLGREREVLKALARLRVTKGNVTVDELVSEMYGRNIDGGMVILTLMPFIEEVLKKLAGDKKVGFEKRCGAKKWFALSAATAETPFS